MASYKLGDPLLTVKREMAIEQLTGQMISGKDFITGERTDAHSFNRWHDYNKELLRRLFTGNKYLIEYGNCFRKGRDKFGRNPDGGDRTVPWSAKDRALAGIENLESLIDRIGLIPEAPDGTSQSRPAVESKPGQGTGPTAAIRGALEKAGVEFIPENGRGAGVRLKKSKPRG